MVLARAFLARPSSIPDIRDFVRSCLSRSPLGEDENRRVFETASQALLEAAEPEGGINVGFRIFPDHVEVDVLRIDLRLDPSGPGRWPPARVDAPGWGAAGPPDPDAPVDAGAGSGPILAAPGTAGASNGAGPAGPRDADDDLPFADWIAGVMRRQGMSMEAAAGRLGVSVKTVGRWIGGTTKPRLRDLRRIRELFGETPPG